MILRLLVSAAALFSTTGCVAVIPLAAQALAGSNMVSRFCQAAKFGDQNTSLCDQARNAMNAPAAKTGVTVSEQRYTRRGSRS